MNFHGKKVAWEYLYKKNGVSERNSKLLTIRGFSDLGMSKT